MNTQPYSGKIAVVYDRDITGLGGGDREALAFAKMLDSYGFETQVVTNVLPIPSAERIATAFGDEFGMLRSNTSIWLRWTAFLRSCSLICFLIRAT